MAQDAVTFAGDRMRVRFDEFGPDTYRLFLKVKAIPETRILAHREDLTFTVEAPARYAAMLGVEPPTPVADDLPLSQFLYDDQQAVVRMALEAKRFACWSGCGSGKTLIGLEVARHVVNRTGGRVLIVSLNEIVSQWVEHQQQFYPTSPPLLRLPNRQAMCEWMSNGGAEQPVAVVNYEKWNPPSIEEQSIPEARSLAGIILDECFAPDTKVDVFYPMGKITPTDIDKVRVGDTIINAAGLDSVSDVHRREVPYAVRVIFNNQRVVCSPNHPWLTTKGWVAAQDLVPGDSLVSTREAVRMVQESLHDSLPELGGEAFLQSVVPCPMERQPTGGEGEPGAEGDEASSQSQVRTLCQGVPGSLQASDEAVLREVLFSEMADVPAGTQGQVVQPANIRQDLRSASPVVAEVRHVDGGGSPPGCGLDSNIAPQSPPAALPPIESHEANTFRAWGQRDWLDGAAASDARCSGVALGAGISFVIGPTDSRLSHALQTRLGEYRAQNRHRGGWSLPPLPPANRSQEGREVGITRVDGLEVLEPGDPQLDQYRDADGKLYFYDLGGTRHPSFSVAGVLVHNSSRLKTGGGKQKWALIKSCRGIEYKLSLTATPAPNDLMEFASQGSFLERMRVEASDDGPGEIIWTFFRRDEKTHRWTVKPHAREAFFRFMSSWSIYIDDPRRYGWRQDFPDVPEPVYLHHAIEPTDGQRKHLVVSDASPDGQLTLLSPDQGRNFVQANRLSQVAKGFRYLRGENGAYERIPSNKPGFVARLVSDEVVAGHQVLVWTLFDAETDLLSEAMSGLGLDHQCLTGKTKPKDRPAVLERFRCGESRVLVSRAAMLGWGMNFQCCTSMVFSGMDFSFEKFFQAVRRAYRHGQTVAVRVHLPVVAGLEDDVMAAIERKSLEFVTSIREMEDCYLRARLA